MQRILLDFQMELQLETLFDGHLRHSLLLVTLVYMSEHFLFKLFFSLTSAGMTSYGQAVDLNPGSVVGNSGPGVGGSGVSAATMPSMCPSYLQLQGRTW